MSDKITGKKQKHVVWDEATIQEHDLLRGTRMVIDEPKTPFSYYDDPEISAKNGETINSSNISEDSKHKVASNVSLSFETEVITDSRVKLSTPIHRERLSPEHLPKSPQEYNDDFMAFQLDSQKNVGAQQSILTPSNSLKDVTKTGSVGDDKEEVAKRTVPLAAHWNNLHEKLSKVATRREAGLESPRQSSIDNTVSSSISPLSAAPRKMMFSNGDFDEEEEKKKAQRGAEFKKNRSKHYNEMEALRRFRAQHPNMSDEEDDDEND